jgi:aminopeptidase N
MPQPIPSYLLALAVGNLEFRAMSKRTGVYAEPEVIEKAAWEFADTEEIMIAAEGLYGPYRWGRYDILVLPPSFPYGGMENPRLTFITPTLLTEDRKSAGIVVSHELAHSWSGNLVTAATWNDFWLNEGFTTYFEHRILEEVYGTEYNDMLSVLELERLKKTINEMGPDNPYTVLHVNLTGHDPETAITLIPYYKGYFFLRLVEETTGRNDFDIFLQNYFDEHAFKSMTTAKFLTLLRDKLLQQNEELEKKIKIDSWVYEPGLPDNVPKVQSEKLEQVASQVQAFDLGTPAQNLETANWTSPQWIYFITNLPESVSYNQMSELDTAFNFTELEDMKILFYWLMLAVNKSYTPAYGALDNFLTSQGNLYFLKKLYTEMAQTPEGKEMALEIYKKARGMYHPLAREMVDGILLNFVSF